MTKRLRFGVYFGYIKKPEDPHSPTIKLFACAEQRQNENYTETYGSFPKPDRAKPESCAVDMLFGLGSQIYYFHDHVAKDSNRTLGHA